MAQQSIMLSDIFDIKLEKSSREIWNDGGSGADYSVSIWRPQPTPGFFFVGDILYRFHGVDDSDKKAYISLKPKPGFEYVLASPVSYTEVWNDAGSGADLDAFIYRMNCPPGYKALGMVISNWRNETNFGDCKCIKETIELDGKTVKLITPTIYYNYPFWVDAGSGSDNDVALWEPYSINLYRRYKQLQMSAIAPYTFFAGSSYDNPPGDTPYALRVKSTDDDIQTLYATFDPTISFKGLPESVSEKAKKWAPIFDFDEDSCYAAPAISNKGQMNPGLEPDSLTTGCRETNQLLTANTYCRIASIVQNGDIYEAIMYALYFQKDTSDTLITSHDHKHDWEYACVWLKNGQMTHATFSAHKDEGETKPKQDLFFDKGLENNVKIVYHKGSFTRLGIPLGPNMSTHSMRFAKENEEAENITRRWLTPKLVEWNRLDANQRNILSNYEAFGAAKFPLNDYSITTDDGVTLTKFQYELKKYLPEGYPSFDGWNGAPITDLYVTNNGNVVPKGYEIIPIDLNKGAGAGSDYVHLCYTRDPLKEGITNVVIESTTNVNYTPPPGYIAVPNNYNEPLSNLNRGTAGDKIYISFKREPERPQIYDIDILEADDVVPQGGWAKLTDNLNKGTAGRELYLMVRY